MSISEHPDPLATFDEWLQEAASQEPSLPDAVALATVDQQGMPSVRMVLLKGADESGFVFYTNLESRKGEDLKANPRAALCFHWKSLGKQVRVEGRVEPVSDEEADAYFATRPRDACIGAWASKQSRPLPDRARLEEDFADCAAKFGESEVPRPVFWSGYRVVPERIEFWQSRPSRLHDRLVYTRASQVWSWRTALSVSVARPSDPMVESEQTAEHPIGAELAEGQAETLLRRATYASVGVAVLLAVVKLAAWLFTGSVAMLASFVDSVLDVLASGVNLVAVREAVRPADRQHRFGHGKAEPLAGLIQALVVGASVVFLLSEAGERLIRPMPVEHGAAGIAVMLFAMAATFVLILFQRHVVRKTGSIAIAADSLHFRADLVVNLSVIVALVLSTYLGLDYLDPLFAIGIAAYVLYSVWSLVRSSFDMLMDREFPDDVRARIREIAMGHPEVLDMHDMRTRSAGMNSFIQLHIELKGDISLKRAHVIADEVEDEIRKAFPNTDIIIHQDPEGIVEKRAVFQ